MFFVFASQPTDIFPAIKKSVVSATRPFWPTLWCDKPHRMKLLQNCQCQHHVCKPWAAATSEIWAPTESRADFFFGRERSCVCASVSQRLSSLFFLAGNPWRSPHSVYIQTGGQASGLHMNLRLLRERHTSWEGFCKCMHPLKTFLCCSPTPYITHAALFTTPLSLYDRQTSPPSPPHPPTLCSLYHPLTWPQTSESLRTPVVLYLFFPLMVCLKLRNFLVHCYCVRNSSHPSNAKATYIKIHRLMDAASCLLINLQKCCG